MTITGSLTHPIYPQTGSFYFLGSFSFGNPTGQGTFGFSGYNTHIAFSFKNGKVYDWKNNLIGFYNDVNQLILSGNVNTGTADYYINSQPVAFGVNRSTGYLSGVYISTNNQVIDMSLNINGNFPDYTLSGLSVFNTGASTVPFMIINNSPIAFQIFSGQLMGNVAKFSLQSVPTGYVQASRTFNLVPSGAITLGFDIVPVDLYTDFGLVRLQIEVSGSGQL